MCLFSVHPHHCLPAPMQPGSPLKRLMIIIYPVFHQPFHRKFQQQKKWNFFCYGLFFLEPSYLARSKLIGLLLPKHPKSFITGLMPSAVFQAPFRRASLCLYVCFIRVCFPCLGTVPLFDKFWVLLYSLSYSLLC